MEKCNLAEKNLCCFKMMIDTVMSKVKKFNLFDFTIMKICLSFMGIFIGIKCSDKLKKSASTIGFIALLSYLYMLYKFFVEEEKTD